MHSPYLSRNESSVKKKKKMTVVMGIRVKRMFLPHHQEQKQLPRETKHGISMDERKVQTHYTARDKNRVGYDRCVSDLMEAYSQLAPYEYAGIVVRMFVDVILLFMLCVGLLYQIFVVEYFFLCRKL